MVSYESLSIMDVTIRLDHLDDSDPNRLISFCEHYDRVLIYEEEAEETKKLHYQGFITFSDEKSYNAAKVRFSTMFKSHTRGHKSMTKVKKEEYKSYICKDKNKFYSKGISDEEIKELEDKSYKKDDKNKKVIVSQFQKAYNYCKEQGITSSDHGWKICCTLKHYYTEKVKCEPNDFQLKVMTKSIAKHLVYEYAINNNRKDIYDRYLMDRAKEIIGSDWPDPNYYLQTKDKI